jgi:hypothetical protein
MILGGKARSPATGETYEIKDGYLDLLKSRTGVDSLTNLLPGAGRGYEPLQRFLSTGGIRFFDPDELQSLLDHAGFEPDPPQTYGPVFFSGATRRG